MKKRINISKPQDTKINLIRFRFEGAILEHFCDSDDWEVYELKLKLVEMGADENMLDELYQMGYESGYDNGCENCPR